MFLKEPRFQIELSSPDKDIIVIKCIGNLILPHCSHLRGAVQGQLKLGAKALILDLSGITKIDTVGLAGIIAAYVMTHSQGAYFILAQSAMVRRVLMESKTAIMPYFEKLDEAIAHALEKISVMSKESRHKSCTN